jgi:hypothetical protein
MELKNSFSLCQFPNAKLPESTVTVEDRKVLSAIERGGDLFENGQRIGMKLCYGVEGPKIDAEAKKF